MKDNIGVKDVPMLMGTDMVRGYTPNTDASIGTLTEGATVEEVSVPFHRKGAAIWTPISKSGNYLSRRNLAFGRRGHALAELNALFHPLTQEKWDNAYVSTENIYLNGAYAETHLPTILSKATNLSGRLRDEYDAALTRCDGLVLPNLPYLANSHVASTTKPVEMIAKQVGLTANTALFNQSRHPVLAMPIGMLEIEEGPLEGSGVKLPVSMQVAGKRWHEMDVYRVAYAWSLTNGWREMCCIGGLWLEIYPVEGCCPS